MLAILLSLFLSTLYAFPLQQESLVLLRTPETRPSAGGNNILYKELILEEWTSNSPNQLLQSWKPNCTLPDLQTESLREGLLRPRYPYGDGIWFLCRNVAINASLNISPAPVTLLNLDENGNLVNYFTDSASGITFPPASTTNLVVPYQDISQGLNAFYLLGGAIGAGPGTNPRTTQPRIRVDSGLGTPVEVQGPLTSNLPNGANPVGLTIMTDSLFMPTLIPNGTSLAFFSIYLVGTENSPPLTARNPVSFAVYDTPQMLSSWTFPNVDIAWYTGFNRLPYLARTNYSDPDLTKQTQVFTQFPGSASGSLGITSWRINTARFETAGETVYITNGTHLYRNTLSGLVSRNPFQYVLESPPGWRLMDVHARAVQLPSPSPSASATATSSSSATASSSSSASPSATATASSSSSASTSISATSSASTSASASATTTATSSASVSSSISQSSSPISPYPTPSVTPTPTASNGSIPFIPNNAPSTSTLTPGETAGVSIGSIVAVMGAGFLILKFTPAFKNFYTSKFGASVKVPPQSLKVRSPISSPDAQIVINHNPQIMVLQRLEQLKTVQKNMSVRELQQESDFIKQSEKTKKEFLPVVSTKTT